VSVICPGFAADCLETLEEIGMENRDVFLAAGGEKDQYIAALSARADHVAALGALVSRELSGSHPAVALESSACSG
jgi:ferrochelatase